MNTRYDVLSDCCLLICTNSCTASLYVFIATTITMNLSLSTIVKDTSDLACEQALLFGRASRERASEGPRKGELRRSLARSRKTRFARPNRRAFHHYHYQCHIQHHRDMTIVIIFITIINIITIKTIITMTIVATFTINKTINVIKVVSFATAITMNIALATARAFSRYPLSIFHCNLDA